MPAYPADYSALLQQMQDQLLSGITRPLFNQGTPLAGDTITGATALTAFASQGKIRGVTTKPTDMVSIICAGDYENPTGAVNPTAEPQIYLNEIQAGTAGSQSAGVGTGVAHPFLSLTFINIMDLKTCNVFGIFAFEGVNSVTAFKLFGSKNLAVDFTKDVAVSARVITNAAGANATFRLGPVSVWGYSLSVVDDPG